MKILTTRNALLACTAIGTLGFMPAQVHAQGASADESAGGLQEIVVTAQKREQNLQDVPIAVTALTGDTLQTNRVTSVSDLSGLAPGVIVRTAAGGSMLPSFSIRGAISYGVAPGSDKQVSLYIDGVYLTAARGAIFDLPDVERIEMLRGPQGTLFGRNATAGAVSITTRDPTGEFGVKASLTAGNYGQFRGRVSVDFPQVGAFSGYATYVHNYKRGDIRNANAGIVWDRSAAGLGKSTSAEFLGTRKSDSYFVALKYEPSETFSTVYKFDRNDESGTPEGSAFINYNAAAPGIGALAGPIMAQLLTSQPGPVYYATNGQRPEIVNNGFAVPNRQRTQGHSLTSKLELSDNLSLRNIAAYRKSHLVATSALDGIAGLTFTQQTVIPFATFAAFSQIGTNFADVAAATAAIPGIATSLQPLVGSPFVMIGTQPETVSKQWSDELQLNYNSDLLTLTAGAIWFHSDERSGMIGLPGNVAFTPVFNGVVSGSQGVNYNKQTSLAAYGQAEIHATPQLDLVLGARITKDHKTGSLVYGPKNALTTGGVFDYKKTKPNWLVGLNYKPTDDLLLYAKFSTAFVSGGSVSGLNFDPETATSWEAGIKADLLDKRLRTNLSLFSVTYKNFQTAQSGTNFRSLFPTPQYPAGFADIVGTIVIPQGGPVKAKGFEFEATAAPARGVTVGSSLSYTDTKFIDVNPLLVAQAGGDYSPGLRAKWTGGLWGQYVTEPVFGDSTLMFRVDANWHSRFWLSQNRVTLIPAFSSFNTVAPSWTVNARVALRDISIGGAKAELAGWVRNLTQNREIAFANQTLRLLGSANYVPARTFGVDLTFEF